MALVRHLELPKVDVVGHSMGGMIAMECAVRHYPDLVDNLVLAATGPVDSARNNDLFATLGAALRHDRPRPWFRNLFYWVLTTKFFDNATTVDALVKLAAAIRTSSRPPRSGTRSAPSRRSMRRSLSTIRAPHAGAGRRAGPAVSACGERRVREGHPARHVRADRRIRAFDPQRVSGGVHAPRAGFPGGTLSRIQRRQFPARPHAERRIARGAHAAAASAPTSAIIAPLSVQNSRSGKNTSPPRARDVARQPRAQLAVGADAAGHHQLRAARGAERRQRTWRPARRRWRSGTRARCRPCAPRQRLGRPPLRFLARQRQHRGLQAAEAEIEVARREHRARQRVRRPACPARASAASAGPPG